MSREWDIYFDPTRTHGPWNLDFWTSCFPSAPDIALNFSNPCWALTWLGFFFLTQGKHTWTTEGVWSSWGKLPEEFDFETVHCWILRSWNLHWKCCWDVPCASQRSKGRGQMLGNITAQYWETLGWVDHSSDKEEKGQEAHGTTLILCLFTFMTLGTLTNWEAKGLWHFQPHYFCLWAVLILSADPTLGCHEIQHFPWQVSQVWSLRNHSDSIFSLCDV